MPVDRATLDDGRLAIRDNDEVGTTVESELPRLADPTTTPKGPPPSAAAEGGVQPT